MTIAELTPDLDPYQVELSPSTYSDIVAQGRDSAAFKVKRLY